MAWNWATQLDFAHRLMALLLLVGFAVWAWRLLRSAVVSNTVKWLVLAVLLALNLRILLGGGVIWTARAPLETTLHVLNGAIVLSMAWAVTFSFFKPILEGEWAQ